MMGKINLFIREYDIRETAYIIAAAAIMAFLAYLIMKFVIKLPDRIEKMDDNAVKQKYSGLKTVSEIVTMLCFIAYVLLDKVSVSVVIFCIDAVLVTVMMYYRTASIDAREGRRNMSIYDRRYPPENL